MAGKTNIHTFFFCVCVRASHVNYLFLALFNSCSGIPFTSSLVIVENNNHIYIKQFGESVYTYSLGSYNPT